MILSSIPTMWFYYGCQIGFFMKLMKSTRVSAPGKVLIAGGYLVLEQEFSGAVLASTARFHTTISLQSTGESNDLQGKIPVQIQSPQFQQTLNGVLSNDAFQLK